MTHARLPRRWQAQAGAQWAPYLAEFHRDRAGITEALLSRAVSHTGDHPYEWVARSVGDVEGSVVDIGCGSGPTQGLIPGWVGFDVSPGELAGAQARGRGPLAFGSAQAMPVASGAASAVMAVMSLMVVDDPPAAVAEAGRMLRPGGRLTVLLPADRPLTLLDLIRYAVLLAVVGRRAAPFPHREVGRQIEGLLCGAGFEVTGDERARFAFPMEVADDADLFVDALYLPGVSARRVRVARAVARRWGHRAIGLPLRRVTAQRT